MLSDNATALPTLRALHEMLHRDSDIGEIARKLYVGGRPPVAFVVDAGFHDWIREIGHSAPERIRFGIISQIAMPAQSLFLELPSPEGGTGIFAELIDGNVIAQRVDCDDEDVWVRGLYASCSFSPAPTPFDWAESDLDSWHRDPRLDRAWGEWAEGNIRAMVRDNWDATDTKMTNEIFEKVLVPDLITLAAVFGPRTKELHALAGEMAKLPGSRRVGGLDVA